MIRIKENYIFFKENLLHYTLQNFDKLQIKFKQVMNKLKNSKF
jgi:hypothetical protein